MESSAEIPVKPCGGSKNPDISQQMAIQVIKCWSGCGRIRLYSTSVSCVLFAVNRAENRRHFVNKMLKTLEILGFWVDLPQGFRSVRLS